MECAQHRAWSGDLVMRQVNLARSRPPGIIMISIPAKYKILNYAVGPVENEDLFLSARQDIEATWYALMQQWKMCPMSKEHCPRPWHLIFSFVKESF
jgi:hypothetical protein